MKKLNVNTELGTIVQFKWKSKGYGEGIIRLVGNHYIDFDSTMCYCTPREELPVTCIFGYEGHLVAVFER